MATVVLALGIAANTLVFSVIETTLLRPVPYDQPDALVLINERSPVSEREPVAFDDYRDWRPDTMAFEALAAGNSETFNLTGMGDPEQVSGSNVSAGLFEVLRVKPFLGRLFTEADDHPTAAPVVVITHACVAQPFPCGPRHPGPGDRARRGAAGHRRGAAAGCSLPGHRPSGRSLLAPRPDSHRT